MKKVWVIILSIGLYVIVIPVSISLYNDYQVYSKGGLVDVQITASSNSLGFIRFKMNDKIYDKKIDKGYIVTDSTYKKGNIIKLKYLKGYEDDFLFPGENPVYGSISAICLIMFCATGLLYYVFIKKDVS